jgi:hypothetical protein
MTVTLSREASGGSRKKIFLQFIPHNPLKKLDSDERIQGNPRESNTSVLRFGGASGANQENPNGSDVAIITDRNSII